MMNDALMTKAVKLASAALLAAMVAGPLSAYAQESHAEAKAQVERHDRHHHTKAKIVGGSAAGGAVVGAAAGGPVGAVVGAGVGATGGVVANKIRKHHEIKKREEYGHPTPQ
jgi:phage tail tape-measure protein